MLQQGSQLISPSLVALIFYHKFLSIGNDLLLLSFMSNLVLKLLNQLVNCTAHCNMQVFDQNSIILCWRLIANEQRFAQSLYFKVFASSTSEGQLAHNQILGIEGCQQEWTERICLKLYPQQHKNLISTFASLAIMSLTLNVGSLPNSFLLSSSKATSQAYFSSLGLRSRIQFPTLTLGRKR